MTEPSPCCPTCGQVWRKHEMPTEIAFNNGAIYYKGIHLSHMPKKPYRLLEFLFENFGCVVSRIMIYDRLYPDYDIETYKVIDVFISKIRNYIRENNLPYVIKTEHGSGYYIYEVSNAQ